MTITKITVGADPEFFLIDSKTRTYVSAHDMIPGTKQAPHPVDGGAIQVDGTAVEFNIHPANSENEFISNIQTVLNVLREMIPKRYEFTFSPSVIYNRLYFEKLPRQAVELGCTPDWNGYTVAHNPIPEPVGTMRTGSGHVHLGWEIDGVPFSADPEDRQHILNCARLSRNLDVTLGLPSLDWDADRNRRKMYGKAGCFRPKPYGFEYRTLSNSWLRDVSLMRKVYRGAVEGTRDYLEKGPACLFMQQNMEQIRERINVR